MREEIGAKVQAEGWSGAGHRLDFTAGREGFHARTPIIIALAAAWCGPAAGAAIHRWTVDGAEGQRTEVLVVSRVAQLEDRQGCVVGLVTATGHPDANEAARRLADERARGFRCGVDAPVEIGRPPSFGGARVERR